MRWDRCAVRPESFSVSAVAIQYRQLIDNQIVPHLGNIPLQKLKPAHIAEWHAALIKGGAKDGGPLAAGTVQQSHRVLHKALEDATRHETLTRNPASVVSPPRDLGKEVEILAAGEAKELLVKISTIPSIYPQIVVLLATGMRRGELMGMQWGDIDMVAGKLQISRAVEKTEARGLRLKSPKTRHGRRTISLPAGAVEVLRKHRQAQLELRIALGLGKMPADAFVFGTEDGKVRDPDKLTQEWQRLTTKLGIRHVTLHALRHSHASALIAGGFDVVTVSRRLGHASSVTTLGVYAHLFDRGDEHAAKAIDEVLDIGG